MLKTDIVVNKWLHCLDDGTVLIWLAAYLDQVKPCDIENNELCNDVSLIVT